MILKKEIIEQISKELSLPFTGMEQASPFIACSASFKSTLISSSVSSITQGA